MATHDQPRRLISTIINNPSNYLIYSTSTCRVLRQASGWTSTFLKNLGEIGDGKSQSASKTDKQRKGNQSCICQLIRRVMDSSKCRAFVKDGQFGSNDYKKMGYRRRPLKRPKSIGLVAHVHTKPKDRPFELLASFI